MKTVSKDVYSLLTKIKVRLNGFFLVEAHTQSCVYILVPTRILILKHSRLAVHVCSGQYINTSEDKVKVFYAIKVKFK